MSLASAIRHLPIRTERVIGSFLDTEYVAGLPLRHWDISRKLLLLLKLYEPLQAVYDLGPKRPLIMICHRS